ncbi:MAG: S41 family peptidase [Anaerolineae bacterium]|nr:S41 family peptidase [Anaerolineae bacterium]
MDNEFLPVPELPKRKSNAVKYIVLGMTGFLVSTLIFVIGVTVGIASQRGFAFGGASPFVNRLPAIGATPSASTGVTNTGKLNTALIENVVDRLKTQWYGDFPSDAILTDGAIRGMVNALGDQYTAYVEPKFAKLMEDDITGTFEGIGATLNKKSNAISIVRTFENSPARKGGVLPGDIIEAVNGTKVGELSTTEVAALVRGPRGTNVTLTLRRAEQVKPFDLVLTRDKISIPVVTNKLVDDPAGSGRKVAYASLYDFSGQSTKQLSDVIEAMLKEKPVGLVLDLRNNGGGLLDQATRIGDMFLKEGVYIIQRDSKGKEETRKTGNSGIAQDIPLVVLVNNGSASASEVLAGAIQDYKRGILIGETTFGKGSVQLPQSLPNGGQLRITIQRWYTPLGRTIQGVGITPDYGVARTLQDEQAERDPQLDAAVNYLLTGALPASK